MTENRESPPAGGVRAAGPSLYMLAALASACLAFGAKLILIRRYGSDVPFWDEWDAVGRVLLIPRAQGSLHAANFLAHHNEHRIVLTRLLSYFLAVSNGQWDGLLEMTVNAAIHAGFCAALVVFAGRFVRGVRFAVAATLTTLLFCQAFDWENTLVGFQSQFYFLEWSALGMFLLCIPSRALSGRWWMGWLCGLVGLGTMASGFLAPMALLVVMILRGLIDRRWSRRDTVAAAFLCALCIVGMISVTHVPGHDRYRAHSTMEWIAGVAALLSWPDSGWEAAFLVVQAPIFLLLVERVGSRRLSGNEAILAALAAWTWLQIAAIANGRMNLSLASPRYTDVFAIGIFANGVALFLILRRGFGRVRLGLAAAAWLALVATGLWRLDRDARMGTLDNLPALKSAERRHIKAFLSHGDLEDLKASPAAELPYPSASMLAGFLTADGINSMLPVGIRPPLELSPASGSGGFALSAPASLPAGSGDRIWFAAKGPAKFVSRELIGSDLPFVHMEFCGSPDLDGSALHLESARVNLSPGGNPLSADRWQTADFSVSRELPSRLVVEIPPGDHWLAFTEPIEMGRESWVDRWLLRHSGWITDASAVFLAAGLLAISLIERRRPLG
jgi:hypothetical protein